MPICKKCNTIFPFLIKINGQMKNLGKRKYCLTCSPFGKHNTKTLEYFVKNIKNPNTICTNCSRKIYKKPSHLSNNYIHFCNRKCMNEYNKSRSSATLETCAECTKNIFRTNSQRRKSLSGIFFCSKLCGNKYKSKRKMTKWPINNPKNHRSRKKIILERSGFSCQKCGYKEDSRMLDIHHHDGDHSNNDWNNLRCVCSWCHVKHHRGVEKLDLPILKTQNQVLLPE